MKGFQSICQVQLRVKLNVMRLINVSCKVSQLTVAALIKQRFRQTDGHTDGSRKLSVCAAASFNLAKLVRVTGKSSFIQSWIINWSCSIFPSLPLGSPFLLPALTEEVRMVTLHRGTVPLFVQPAEESPLHTLHTHASSFYPFSRLSSSQEPAGFSRDCQKHWGAFKTKSTFWAFCCVCVCECFKSLSPGHLSYLRHITRCLIRALQKGPVSARLTSRRKERRGLIGRWMDGWWSRLPPLEPLVGTV